MDPRVRAYLIRAHNKVIGHYHQVLQSNSVSHPERERIQRRLADVQAELENLRRRVANPQAAEAA